jgi:hypothetical protein
VTSPANSTTTDTGRTYLWPKTGETFDSVTTIIKYGTPTGYGLQKWMKKVNVEYAVKHRDLWLPMAQAGKEQAAVDSIVGEADRQRDSASVRGSDVHDWAEKVVLGTAVGEAPLLIRPYVEQFTRFLREWRPEYEATEATVYSRQHGYAGTLDWIARIPGHGLVLGDYKTKPDGKTIYGEVGLQLAAYRYADFIGLPDGTEAPVPEVDAVLALVIHPSSYELIPVRADRDVFRSFLYVQQVRRFCDETAKTVLAKKLHPPPAPMEVERAAS